MHLLSPESKIINNLTEKLIRTAARMVNIGEVEAQLRKNPHPIFLPAMDACLGEIEKIEHERTRVLLHDMVILGFWKMYSGNSFRQPAISIFERLSSVLPGLPYAQYRREPRDWRINMYDRQYKEWDAKMRRKANRRKEDGKA